MFKHKFCSAQACADRLYNQFTKHPDLIVAVDFDDTVLPYVEDFDCGEVIELLRRADNIGFRLVVFTASNQNRFEKIEEFYKNLGIKIHGINKNLLDEKMEIGKSGKIYYNLLLCDRAGLGSALETLQILLDRIEEEKANPSLLIASPQDIPADWEYLTVRKKTLYRVRHPMDAEEKITIEGGELTAVKGVDLILADELGKLIPIKKDIFLDTYEIADIAETFQFRKKVKNVIVKIPEGITVTVKSLEGDVKASHPDFVVIGAAGEVYTNTLIFVEDNLEIIK